MPKNAHAHFILGLMYQRLSQPQKVSFRSTINSFCSLIDSICFMSVNFVLFLGDFGLWEGWRDIASLRGRGSSAGFAFLGSNSPRPGLVIFCSAFCFFLLCEIASLVQIHHPQVFVYLFIISIKYVMRIIECVYCSVFCLKLVAIIAWRRNLKGKSLRTFCLNWRSRCSRILDK